MEPNDEQGHGTAVAGIAGAVSNNETGIAGVSWGSKLLIVRVLDGNKSGYISDLIEGIKYATNYGAKIINLSVVVDGIASSENQKKICDATSNAIASGRIVVAAAGNDGKSAENSFPAACSGVLTVGNVDSSNNVHSTSNYGPSIVDIGAPGVNIQTTVPIGAVDDCFFCTPSGYKSQAMTGTSFAAPFVSGSAAVLLEYDSSINTSKDVIQRFKDTAEPTTNPDKITGRVDLYAALIAPQFKDIEILSIVKTSTPLVSSFPDVTIKVTPGAGTIEVDSILSECTYQGLTGTTNDMTSSPISIVLGDLKTLESIAHRCGVSFTDGRLDLTITGNIEGVPVTAIGGVTIPAIPKKLYGTFDFSEAIWGSDGDIVRKASITQAVDQTIAKIYETEETVLDGSTTVTSGTWVDKNGSEREARYITYTNYVQRMLNCSGGCPTLIYNGSAVQAYHGLRGWEFVELNVETTPIDFSQYITKFHPSVDGSNTTEFITQFDGWGGFYSSPISGLAYAMRHSSSNPKVVDSTNAYTVSWTVRHALIDFDPLTL